MMEWFLLFTMITHPACEYVNNDHIFGADLSHTLSAFAGIPADTIIGYSPAPGSRRILQFPELKRLGAQYGIPVPPESQACFEWKTQLITEDMVRDAIRESLHAPDARIEIMAMSKIPAPPGKLVFPLDGLSAASNTDPSTPVTWRGYVLYSSARRFSLWARVKISTTAPRIVALEPLAPGKPIEKHQVRLETVDDFPLRDLRARSLDEVIGRIPRRAVPAGSPVLRSDLTEAFQVETGSVVEVTAISGAAQLQLEAVAQSSARQGDLVSLRNPRSGKTFRARVEGKGKAIVLSDSSGLTARAQ